MKKDFLLTIFIFLGNFYSLWCNTEYQIVSSLSREVFEENPPVLWSVLICTLESRKTVFEKLYKKLETQINDAGLQGQIEILHFLDGPSIFGGF